MNHSDTFCFFPRERFSDLEVCEFNKNDSDVIFDYQIRTCLDILFFQKKSKAPFLK